MHHLPRRRWGLHHGGRRQRPAALYAINRDGTHERQIVPYTVEVGIKHDWERSLGPIRMSL
jgi:hypothetical protein